MTDQDSEAELRRLAIRRVNARFRFWRHALTFVVVNAGLIAINLYYSPHFWWFVFPLFGWGFGLLMHGLSVFSFLSGVRERSIEAELARLRRRRG